MSAVIQSGHLDYINPVTIATKYLNIMRAVKSKNQALLNAAKNSTNFDTTKGFFSDINYREHVDRLKPWTQKTITPYIHEQKVIKSLGDQSTTSNNNSQTPSTFSEFARNNREQCHRQIQGKTDGKIKIVKCVKKHMQVQEFLTTNVKLEERVKFTHIKQEDYYGIE